jgi:RecB family exonuclease
MAALARRWQAGLEVPDRLQRLRPEETGLRVLLDPVQDPPLTPRQEAFLERLPGLTRADACLPGDGPGAAPGTALGLLQRAAPGPAPPDESLFLLRPRDPWEEAEVAAAAVLAHLGRGGRLPEVALLVPRGRGYAEILQTVFASWEIPLSLPERTTFACFPALEGVRAALALLADPPDPNMALLALFLPGLDAPAALIRRLLDGPTLLPSELEPLLQGVEPPERRARLASWLFQRGNRAVPQGGGTPPRPVNSSIPAGTNSPDGALQGDLASEAVLQRLKEVVALHAPPRRQLPPEARQARAAAASLAARLAEEVRGQGPILPLARLEAWLRRARAGLTLPPDPGAGGVCLRHDTDWPDAPYPLVLVLGFQEGEFPRLPPPDPVWPDRLRRALGCLPQADQVALRGRERLFGWVRAAGRVLVVSSPCRDAGGREVRPSATLVDLVAPLGEAWEHRRRLQGRPSSWDAGQVLPLPGTPSWQDLLRRAPEAPRLRCAVTPEHPESRAVLARALASEGRGAALARTLLLPSPGTPAPGSPPRLEGVSLSASALESLLGCRFRFWAERLSGLRSVDLSPLGDKARLLGNLTHAALEELCRPGELPDLEEWKARAAAAFESALARRGGQLLGPRRALARELVRRQFLDVATRLHTLLRQHGLVPVGAEQSFEISLEVPGFGEFPFRGFIDLMAAGPSGVAVLDLKYAGRRRRTLNLDSGVDFQLPLYLRAATRLQERPPLGAAYIFLTEPCAVGLGSCPGWPGRPGVDPDQVLDGVLRRAASAFERIAAGDVATPTEEERREWRRAGLHMCTWCRLGGLCRDRQEDG